MGFAEFSCKPYQFMANDDMPDLLDTRANTQLDNCQVVQVLYNCDIIDTTNDTAFCIALCVMLFRSVATTLLQFC